MISNAANREAIIDGAINIEMQLRDLIVLGNCCGEVHSVRSGLCDCLAGIGSRLFVYYTAEMDTYAYSIKNCFYDADEVNEIFVDSHTCTRRLMS